MAICKQKVSSTENCKREVYKDDLCIIHHKSADKPSNSMRAAVRDDCYNEFYNFSYMISYDGLDLEGLKISNDIDLIFKNSYFAGPFKIKNLKLKASLDFTDANFDSGLFITMSDIHKEIIIKNSKIGIDFNLSLSNLFSIDIDNLNVECNFNISNTDIHDKLTINHVHFKNNFNMLNSSLQGDTKFENIIIDGDADFRNIMFYKSLKFENVQIRGKTIPEEMIQNTNIDFKNTYINGLLIQDNQKDKKNKEKKKKELEKIKQAKEKMYKDTFNK